METNNFTPRILAVDDEPFDLMLIERYLTRAGFEVKLTANGDQAWRLLHSPGYEPPHAILLDRQMPVIDGIEFLRLMMADPQLRDIPVIMQTGLSEPDQIAYGIACGARYYLAKPFSGELLVAMVRAAVNDNVQQRALRSAANELDVDRALLRRADYEFHTLDEAHKLAQHLAGYFADPQRVIGGIVEILINAVEHGNLGLTYADKSELLKKDGWQAEIERRFGLPEFRSRRVFVRFEIQADRSTLTIRDEGAGFDWNPYLEIQPERAFHLHGRGIAMSKLMSFDEVNYSGNGNTVELVVKAVQPDRGDITAEAA